MADRLKDWARIIKRDVHALYLASRYPRVPWYAKAMAVVVAGYASLQSISFQISSLFWGTWTT